MNFFQWQASLLEEDEIIKIWCHHPTRQIQTMYKDNQLVLHGGFPYSKNPFLW